MSSAVAPSDTGPAGPPPRASSADPSVAIDTAVWKVPAESSDS